MCIRDSRSSSLVVLYFHSPSHIETSGPCRHTVGLHGSRSVRHGLVLDAPLLDLLELPQVFPTTTTYTYIGLFHKGVAGDRQDVHEASCLGRRIELIILNFGPVCLSKL